MAGDTLDILSYANYISFLIILLLLYFEIFSTTQNLHLSLRCKMYYVIFQILQGTLENLTFFSFKLAIMRRQRCSVFVIIVLIYVKRRVLQWRTLD